jgi:hypothetical protein
MSFQLGIIQKSLATAFIGALKKFVAVDGIVLFQRGPVMEDFAARVQWTPENFGLLLCGSPVGSSTHHSSPFLEQGAHGSFA